MGKKTFTSGLSDLFSDALAEDSQEELTILASSKTIARKRKTKTTKRKKTTKPKKEPNLKSFASDLDSFFQDAITDSVEEQVEELKNGKKVKKPARRRKPNFGLDNLIRQTLETSTVVTVKDTPSRKRVTFLFDKEKLAEFKQIVRSEKAYMKDIIGGLVSEYLEQYKNDKLK